MLDLQQTVEKEIKVNIIHIKLPSHTLTNYDDINVILYKYQ